MELMGLDWGPLLKVECETLKDRGLLEWWSLQGEHRGRLSKIVAFISWSLLQPDPVCGDPLRMYAESTAKRLTMTEVLPSTLNLPLPSPTSL